MCDQALPLSLFDYELPERLIAQAPVRPRDASRMLVLAREAGAPQHHRFLDLPAFFKAGDLLVVNETRVLPARLPVGWWGAEVVRGAAAPGELLLCEPMDGGLEHALVWKGLGRPGRRLKVGRELVTASGTRLTVRRREGREVWVEGTAPLLQTMMADGEMPLPPYIRRRREESAGETCGGEGHGGCEDRMEGRCDDGTVAAAAGESDVGSGANDRRDYQSMFASQMGAVAAPTASLHFTPRVMDALAARGVRVARLVLHVGLGTFLPLSEEACGADVRGHVMHVERYSVPESAAGAVEATRAAGGRVVAAGTTALRALETWGQTGCLEGTSDLFVYPGYEFRVVDGLVTNFHLPKSTLLMLISAMAGRERVLAAYQEAIAREYRFFSYGDAMLIL